MYLKVQVSVVQASAPTQYRYSDLSLLCVTCQVRRSHWERFRRGNLISSHASFLLFLPSALTRSGSWFIFVLDLDSLPPVHAPSLLPRWCAERSRLLEDERGKLSCISSDPLQKSFLGLVQSAPCRIDIEFKDAQGRPYKDKATVKTKGTETEDLPLYTNKDDLIGEVGG